jgi:hypothetical protein
MKVHFKSLAIGLVFGVTIASTTVAFASNTVQGVFSQIKLVVNGQSKQLNSKPVNINKTDYVSLKEVATLFGYTTKYDEKTKTYSINNQKQTPAPTQNVGVGNLKGTITWQYNKVIGTKGDVGAKIFLIPKNFDKSKISKSDGELFATIGSVPKDSGLQYVKANGYGDYELSGIQAGKYYLVISSKNTTRNFQEDLSDYVVSTLKPIIPNWDIFVQFNLHMNKHEVKEIEITKDKTLDVSYDFGNTFL